MSTKTWYTLQSKAAPKRYDLCENIQILLKTLDWVHVGHTDASELGRLVRLSPPRRASIADTITKCANMIKTRPEELKTCVDIIEMCTEILEIADRPPPPESFPFMKLPIPIRDMILEQMVQQESKAPTIVSVSKDSSCNCPKLIPASPYARRLTLPSTFGPALHDEFYRVLFRNKKIRFRCTCELLTQLSHNERLLQHLRSAVVHWCGPKSPKAFELLAKCPKLDVLTLNLSRSTLSHLQERADFMKQFFPVPYRILRMADALGLDELLEVRGVSEIAVNRLETSSRSIPSETDRANLRDLLCSKLKLDREV